MPLNNDNNNNNNNDNNLVVLILSSVIITQENFDAAYITLKLMEEYKIWGVNVNTKKTTPKDWTEE